MAKLKILGLLTLLIISGSVSANTISPPGETAFEVYVMGIASTFGDILRATSAFVEVGPFVSIASTLALFAFFTLMAQSMAGIDPKRVGGLFIAIAFSSYMTFTAKTNLVIIETMGNTGTGVASVNQVPASIGLPAAFVSGLGESLIKELEVYFPQGDPYLNFSTSRTINLQGQLLKDLSTIHSFSPDLTQTSSQFYQDCVYPLIANGDIYIQDIFDSKDILGTIKPSISAGTYSMNFMTGNLETCDTLIDKIITEATAQSIAAVGNDSNDWFNGSSTTSSPSIGALANIVFTSLNAPAGTDASSYVLNRSVGRAFDAGLTASNAVSGTDINAYIIEEQAYQSQQSTFDMTINLFTKGAAYTYTIIQVTVYGFAPIILLMTFLPSIAVKSMLSYVKLLIWLAIWQPMLAITNYVIVSIQKNSLINEMGFMMQPSSWGTMSSATDQYITAAAIMGTMIPGLAWMLVNGAADFSKFAAAGVGESFASASGTSMAKGEVSMDNSTFNNTRGNTFSTLSTMDTGWKPRMHNKTDESSATQENTDISSGPTVSNNGEKSMSKVTATKSVISEESAAEANTIQQSWSQQAAKDIQSVNTKLNQLSGLYNQQMASGNTSGAATTLSKAAGIVHSSKDILAMAGASTNGQAVSMAVASNGSAALLSAMAEDGMNNTAALNSLAKSGHSGAMKYLEKMEDRGDLDQLYTSFGAKTDKEKGFVKNIMARTLTGENLSQDKIANMAKDTGIEEAVGISAVSGLAQFAVNTGEQLATRGIGKLKDADAEGMKGGVLSNIVPDYTLSGKDTFTTTDTSTINNQTALDTTGSTKQETAEMLQNTLTYADAASKNDAFLEATSTNKSDAQSQKELYSRMASNTSTVANRVAQSEAQTIETSTAVHDDTNQAKQKIEDGKKQLAKQGGISLNGMNIGEDGKPQAKPVEESEEFSKIKDNVESQGLDANATGPNTQLANDTKKATSTVPNDTPLKTKVEDKLENASGKADSDNKKIDDGQTKQALEADRLNDQNIGQVINSVIKDRELGNSKMAIAGKFDTFSKGIAALNSSNQSGQSDAAEILAGIASSLKSGESTYIDATLGSELSPNGYEPAGFILGNDEDNGYTIDTVYKNPETGNIGTLNNDGIFRNVNQETLNIGTSRNGTSFTEYGSDMNGNTVMKDKNDFLYSTTSNSETGSVSIGGVLKNEDGSFKTATSSEADSSFAIPNEEEQPSYVMARQQSSATAPQKGIDGANTNIQSLNPNEEEQQSSATAPQKGIDGANTNIQSLNPNEEEQQSPATAPQKGIDGANTNIQSLNPNDEIDFEGEQYTLVDTNMDGTATMENQNGQEVTAQLDHNGRISQIDSPTSYERSISGLQGTGAPAATEAPAQPLSSEQIDSLGALKQETIQAESKNTVDAAQIFSDGQNLSTTPVKTGPSLADALQKANISR